MTGKLGGSSTAAFRLKHASNTPAFFQPILIYWHITQIYSLFQLSMTFLSLELWRLTPRPCATRINYAIRHNLPKFLRCTMEK